MIIDFIPLVEQCAPTVDPIVMEAIDTAKRLEKEGFNFSMGLSQVNFHNLQKYNLTYETVFNPCVNLSAGSSIYKDCFDRASIKYTTGQQSMYAAFSCYYSGNFKRGFMPDSPNQPSYVQKVSNRYYGIKHFLSYNN